MELFTGFEADGFAGGDGDLGTGAGIASDAGFAGFDGEDTETAEFDAFATAEGGFHGLEDDIDGGLCLGSREARALHHSLNQVLLDHLYAFLLPRGVRSLLPKRTNYLIPMVERAKSVVNNSDVGIDGKVAQQVTIGSKQQKQARAEADAWAKITPAPIWEAHKEQYGNKER